MINRCPLCGKDDRIEIFSKRAYEDTFQGGIGCVSIECTRCHLRLYEHSKALDAPIEDTYESMRERAINRWNQL